MSRPDFYWYNGLSREFMDRDYLLPGQTFMERVDIICKRAAEILDVPAFAERFKASLAKGYYSLSSPIWANFGTDRGLPISCFGSYIDDSMESILGVHFEVGIMSKHGGGTSGYFGDIRHRGAPIKGGANGTSSGSAHFAQLYDRIINVVSQGSTRRGQFAGYQRIDHPDILEWLQMRTEGNAVQDMSYGVCVPDSFMEKLVARDPEAMQVWAKVLNARAKTGYPYIFFTDNANRQKPDVYRDQRMQIHHSNLCTEIMLPNTDEESFVCDLASMNDLFFEEWKDTDAVMDLVMFLDAVMTEFIEKASKLVGMEKAVRFAERHRALGIGRLGWHSFLQSKLIPFESIEAKGWNVQIQKTIHDQSYEASRMMARIWGEPHYLQGYGRRHTTLMAIAPTKSSSFILGQVSEGIEPVSSNYYVRDLQKGKFSIRNPYLTKRLQELGKDTPDTWDQILKAGGSVQKLAFLSDHDKAVFKTFSEISPREVIVQAAGRQKYLDQGQSTNLLIHPSIPLRDVNALYVEAWRMGLKSLYYQKGVNAAQEFARSISCTSCEA